MPSDQLYQLQEVIVQMVYTHPGIDFDGGDICQLIYVLHGGVIRRPIGQLHADTSLVGNDVSVGHNEPISTDDKTGTVGYRDFPAGKRMPEKDQLS